jgi:hypothetical protein
MLTRLPALQPMIPKTTATCRRFGSRTTSPNWSRVLSVAIGRGGKVGEVRVVERHTQHEEPTVLVELGP